MTTTGKTVSADGRGRTLLQMLFGWNKKVIGPLEFQYHNPCKVKVGQTASFEHDPDLANVNFVLQAIAVYETNSNNQKFYQTVYIFRGLGVGMAKPVLLRLVLTPDDDVSNDLGHTMRVQKLYTEMQYDQGFHEGVLGDPSGIFYVETDDKDQPLNPPWTYKRLDNARLPYNVQLAVLRDKDKDGEVEDDEIAHSQITHWDYVRDDAVDELTGQTYRQYLDIEMDNATKMFTFYRSRDINPAQVRWY